MKRPLALYCTGFVAGITVALFFPASLCLLAAGAIMAVAALLGLLVGKKSRLFVLLLAAFSVAAAVGGSRTAAGDYLSSRYAGQRADVIIKVSDISELAERFYAVSASARCGDDRFAVIFYSSEYQPIGIELEAMADFGEYDRVRCRLEIDELEVSKYEFDSSAISKLRNERLKLAGALKAAVGGDEGAVAAGVLFGDKSDISYPIKNSFINCGTSHILVVSGLHISIIAYLITAIMKRLRMPYLIRSVAVTLSCLVILAALGFSVSVARVTIMTLLVYVGGNTRRRADRLTLLLFSAALIMTFDATAASDVGFWLSFGATFALAVVTDSVIEELKPICSKLPKLAVGVIYSLVCSTSVAVVLIPVEIVFSLSISVISPVANLLVLAVLPFLVGVSIITTLLCTAAPALWLTLLFGSATAFISKVIIKISAFFGGIKNVSFYSGDLPVRIVSMLVVAIFILLVLYLKHRKRLLIPAAALTGALAVAVIVVFSMAASISLMEYKNKITVLSEDKKVNLFMYGNSAYHIERANQFMRLEGVAADNTFALSKFSDRQMLAAKEALETDNLLFLGNAEDEIRASYDVLTDELFVAYIADGRLLYAVKANENIHIIICFEVELLPKKLSSADYIIICEKPPLNIGDFSATTISAYGAGGQIILDKYQTKTLYFLKGGKVLW